MTAARSSPYPVNVSSIQDFTKCRFRWWARWVMNWVPRNEHPALTFGKLLHEVFEEHLGGRVSMNEALRKVRSEWYGRSAPQDERLRIEGALEKLAEFEEPLKLWEDKYPIERTLEVEQPFEMVMPLGDGTSALMKGRPDRVVFMADRVWHMQNRGLAPGVNFGVYTELAKRHYHEHVYGEYLSRKYGSAPYGGTLFNLMRKLKYRTKRTAKNPEGEVKKLSEMFFQHPMTVDVRGPLHDSVMKSVCQHVREMIATERAWLEKGTIPAPNESLNGGPYGNSLDEYFRVLIGEIELGDPRWFKAREDTYATQTASEGEAE